MKLGAVIGALRVVFGAETAAFEKGSSKVQRQMKKTERNFKKSAAKMQRIGKSMSIALTAPLLILAGRSLKAGVAHSEAVAQVEAGLVSMGSASGKVIGQLKRDALELEGASTFNADAVLKDVTAQMLTFGNVADEQFDRAQMAALDMATRLGTDLKGNAILVGKALNDPIKGLSALSRVGIVFTDQQKAQIKSMQEAGDVAGAQGIILAELEKQYGGSAKAQRDAAPGSELTDQWRQFQRILGTFALRVLPPLTAGLSGILEKFNNLSPRMQKIVLVSGAVVAAIGPMLMAFGSIVAGLAPILAGVSAVSVALGGGAGLMGALTLLLGPLGLVTAGIVAGTLAYRKWLSPAAQARQAHKDLYTEIAKSVALRKLETPKTLEQARANLIEAESIRERLRAQIASRQEELKAAKSKLEAARNRQANRQFSAPGYVPPIQEMNRVDVLNKALKDANDEAAQNDKYMGTLTAQISRFERGALDAGDAVSTVTVNLNDNSAALSENAKSLKDNNDKTEKAAQLSGRLGEAYERLASAMIKKVQAHQTTKISVDQEIADNMRLSEALRVSQHEYDVTAAQMDIMRGGFMGTSDEAAVMATRLVASRNELSGVRDAAAKVGTELDSTGEKLDTTGQKAEAAFNGIASSFSKMANGLKSGNIVDILSGILGMLNQIGGLTGGFNIGALQFGGKRATGGPVTGGKTYLVGERGPELFTPGSSGGITPNHKLASQGGGALTVVPSKYFDLVVDDRAANVAKPIAAGTAMEGMGQYNRAQNAANNRSLA